MSTHEVKVIRVEQLLPHPNGDNLQIIQVWGYQCIVRKGVHQIGDLLAYIESDYTVPLDRNEFKFLDDGKGKTRQRITMRRFRGEPSYGLLIPAPAGSQEGDNVMELLGVERYEPPMSGHGFGPTGFKSGLQATGPDLPAPVYDLENFKKYHRLFNENERVIISEKIHGCSSRYVFDGENMHCGSRTTWKMKPGTFIKDVNIVDEAGVEVTKTLNAPENAWWNALEQNPWIESWCRAHPEMVLYGEIYSPHIQGKQFSYGKNDGEYGFAVFDILDHGRWVDNGELFDNPVYNSGLEETVKVLYRGPLDRAMLEKMAEEDSAYPNQKIREGCVVKLEFGERRDIRLGRVALKFVSDRYLMLK